MLAHFQAERCLDLRVFGKGGVFPRSRPSVCHMRVDFSFVFSVGREKNVAESARRLGEPDVWYHDLAQLV